MVLMMAVFRTVANVEKMIDERFSPIGRVIQFRDRHGGTLRRYENLWQGYDSSLKNVPTSVATTSCAVEKLCKRYASVALLTR